MLAWSLFAFGGAYFWTTVPLIAGAVLLAGFVRPSVFMRGSRMLDGALIASVLVIAAQLVPISASMRNVVSPKLAAVNRELYFDARDTAVPLTVDRDATAEALALAVGVVLFFWCARTILGAGGLRRTVRVVAFCGLVASAVAIIQHATAPGLLYWTWRPVSRGASPYSPFVNKNDLAAWLVMAIPLTVGYLVARIDARHRQGLPSWLQASLDDNGAWLLGGACAMTAALIVALSRSGLAAFAAGFAAFAWMSRSRVSAQGRWWFLAGAGVLVIIAATYGNTGAMWRRLAETMAGGLGGRREIWRETWRIIADFPLTGVGVGAYARAMSTYQPPHLFAFNHAHNEYLQVLAEGGVVLTGCVAIAILAGVVQIARTTRRDRSPAFWIRAGAVSGMVGIMLQSIWDTALRLPANAVLFAVCCAVALNPASRGDDG
jgi:O-antigen ligase